MISMILACGLNGEIGDTSRPDGLPWSYNKDDMKFFKETTEGGKVLVGRGTYTGFQKMGMKDGLPNRKHFVLTSRVGLKDKAHVIYVNNNTHLKKLLHLHKGNNLENLWVIGGRSIYEQLHPYCDRVYLTRINKAYPDADVRINLDFLCDYSILSNKKLNEYSHVGVWERKK
ncbi:dihydrofolate reductase [Vibrio phage 184E37-3b]|nr:putative dihydrofolate reductase [Vibrio phage 184E37.3a]QZI90126.1 putative dihydrofolate reductase [Vibrio phage 184E37.1]